MATKEIRRLNPKETRHFGKERFAVPIPDLTSLQTSNYERFLQHGVPREKREDIGLESIFREFFPIENHDGKISLEYVDYELCPPRYEPDECRLLKLTYGRPLRVKFRLYREGKDALESEVFLCDIPIMLGGGEFIINGSERVVVNQLHRSPGIDFITDEDNSDRYAFSCRIIPERGSWIEINISKKDSLQLRIDQSQKFSAMTLLRAMDSRFSSTPALMKEFYGDSVVTLKTKTVKDADKLVGMYALDDVIVPTGEEAGNVLLNFGEAISEEIAERIANSTIDSLEVIPKPKNMMIIESIKDDMSKSHEDALWQIYKRLRPGNPQLLEKAKQLFQEKFKDLSRYRLGLVGRFRINRKLNLDVDKNEQGLTTTDLVSALKYLIQLCDKDPKAQLDDIDHLGNRRLRTIDELAVDELRKGFMKLTRTVKERMNMKDPSELSPQNLVNQKSISSTVDFFFGRGELSQVVDQTNPLSMLTHERRLSALGPGGLNRKRAGSEVRDVHHSHFGRICPIETPEGTNIGLISSLATYAAVDEFGFLTTPYQVVKDGVIQDEIRWLRADEEKDLFFAPADVHIQDGRIVGCDQAIGANVVGRRNGEYETGRIKDVNFIDVSPCQMVGVSAGLIPFLEHDDANRALMGSNMQRQGVPLLCSEAPIVATGMEEPAARNSSLLIRSRRAGKVTYVDGIRCVVTGPVDKDGKVIESEQYEDEYVMRKFVSLNDQTCQNQRPIVKPGQILAQGDIIADGAAIDHGELALGRNVLCAFMVWEGYNYEDAIILSEELVQNDTYTSIHIIELEKEIRDTKLGREEFTRDIPNVSEKALRNLDENGIVRIGTYVRQGDILVGKVSPKSKTELTPEEKLLHAIFGRVGEDVKNDSLEVQSGVEGIVIDTQRIARKSTLSPEEKIEFDTILAQLEAEYYEKIAAKFSAMIQAMEELLGQPIHSLAGETLIEDLEYKTVAENANSFNPERTDVWKSLTEKQREQYISMYRSKYPQVKELLETLERKRNSHKRGDELRNGVLQTVKVFIANKRVLSVGDKMAGRHGNKGVISKIMRREDMPFLADGTPIQILLNPLGVPSRMNVGQVLETHLGWAGATLGFKSITPVFDGAKESEINDLLEQAGLPRNGKARLYDGRTGEPFDQEITVGYIYMLKLHHLVDDKVHARSTGPYSMITQQPLGGKARSGGQRFGEMEVWALEAYGAAYILQELLTVKSDDVDGRTKIYESMVKGENTLEAGTPASFDVLTNEIRGLGLNMQLERGNMQL